MKKIILSVLAVAVAAVVAATIAAVASPASAAKPMTTTTHNITMNAASETVIDLPALNSQFTKMVIGADGLAHWCATASWTEYKNGGTPTTNQPVTTGSSAGRCCSRARRSAS